MKNETEFIGGYLDGLKLPFYRNEKLYTYISNNMGVKTSYHYVREANRFILAKSFRVKDID